MKTIDMRDETLPANRWISDTLKRQVDARISAKEQSLLFINRRGYAPVTICRACGHQIGCDQCDARMVEHIRLLQPSTNNGLSIACPADRRNHPTRIGPQFPGHQTDACKRYHPKGETCCGPDVYRNEHVFSLEKRP